MKKLLLLILPAAFVLTPSLCEARINLLELWHPGVDASVGSASTYSMRPAVISRENYFELPVEFTFVTRGNIEAGGRWSISSHSGTNGLSDLLIGGKHIFVEESPDIPAVLGEAAISLPTGKFSDGLGSGSVDFLLHWAAVKKFSPYTGTFGLGMRINSENSDKFSAGNVFFYHIGVSYPMQSDMTIYGELKGFAHGKSKFKGDELNDDHTELYLAPGVDYTLDKKWTLNCALLVGLTSQSSDLGLLVSTKFK